MVIELLQAFALIFIAEMGDKTQILAMAFASKYKIKQVLIGVFIGSLLNHALAVLLGSNLQYFVPLETLSIIAGFSFILFGLWNLKVDTEEQKSKLSKYGPIVTVSLAFFIGELGDKTQLTAIALSTDAMFPAFILMGTVLGMVFTSMIGIFIGLKLGNKLDEFYIKIGASMIFLLFGYIKLFNSLPIKYLSGYYIIGFSSLVVLSTAFLLKPNLQSRKNQIRSRYQKVALELYEFYNAMTIDIDSICLGEGKCGLCEGNKCPIGYTKDILKVAINKEEMKQSYSEIEITDKQFDLEKVKQSLFKTLSILKLDWNNKEYSEVHIIRMNLEKILFNNTIDQGTFEEYINILIQYDQTFKSLKDDTIE
jgi:putative Ca2+/H+ antiporter (TMEM165/GDT1 family)